MPDKEEKQPSQQPAERDSARRDFSTGRDGEVLKASGARPSPNPDPDPKTPGPINKASDLTDGMREASIPESTFSAAPTETPSARAPTGDRFRRRGSLNEHQQHNRLNRRRCGGVVLIRKGRPNQPTLPIDLAFATDIAGRLS